MKSFIFDKNKKPKDIESFIANQRKEIQKNLNKISVAPGQDGK